MTAPLQLLARVQSLTCCRECERQQVICPSCGRVWYRAGASHREQTITCSCAPGVQTLITVEWAGYIPNPSGEAPPKVLSDDLQRLERCLQRRAADRSAWSMPPNSRPKATPTMEELRRQVGAPPAVAHRHQPPAVAAPQQRPPQHRPKPRRLLDLIERDPSLSPWPPEARRHPLAWFDLSLFAGSGSWPPVTFAGAYRRLLGAEPRYGRGSLSQTRVYASPEVDAVTTALHRAEQALAAIEQQPEQQAQQGGRP